MVARKEKSVKQNVIEKLLTRSLNAPSIKIYLEYQIVNSVCGNFDVWWYFYTTPPPASREKDTPGAVVCLGDVCCVVASLLWVRSYYRKVGKIVVGLFVEKLKTVCVRLH